MYILPSTNAYTLLKLLYTWALHPESMPNSLTYGCVKGLETNHQSSHQQVFELHCWEYVERASGRNVKDLKRIQL